MTHHNKEFPRQAELNKSLKDHGLSVNRPSQLSDAFRFGWRAMFELAAPSQPEGAEPTEVEFEDNALIGWSNSIPDGKYRLHPSQSAGAAAPDEGDGARYRAFFDAGLPITFMGVEYEDKASLDAAIDAALSVPKGEEGKP